MLLELLPDVLDAFPTFPAAKLVGVRDAVRFTGRISDALDRPWAPRSQSMAAP